MPDRLFDRFARALVRLLPVHVRETHGREIEQVLRTGNRERPVGLAAGLRFWCLAVADILRVAPRQHVEALAQDVRYAARSFRRSPAFALAAVITIALGSGAVLAVFVVVNGVLIRPLPYFEPHRLVLLWAAGQDGSRTWLSAPEVEDLTTSVKALEGVAGLTDLRFALTGSGDPEELDVVAASAGTFELLGVDAHIGRLIERQDDVEGAARVVLLSHGLWTRKFEASPAVLGRTIALDGRSYTVVGVLPRGFEIVPPSSVFPEHVDAWVSLQTHLVSRARDVRYLHALGRLRPGSSLEAAREELKALGVTVSRDFAGGYRGRKWTFEAVRMQDDVVRELRPALLVLLTVVALVLVIASANVAALLLARSNGRRREMAVRVALGASRARLVRQLLTEGFVLAFVGAAAGLALASAVPAIARIPTIGSLPRLATLSLDWRVVACAAAVSALTAILFALAPALELSRRSNTRASEALRSAARSRGASRFTNALAAAEVALACSVLVVALLFARTLVGLIDVNIGFATDNVTTARLSLPPRYSTATRLAQFFDEVIRRLESTAGVKAAAAVSQLPLSGAALGSTFTLVGAATERDRVDVDLRAITAGYLAALDIPVVRGRAFAASDTAQSVQVAIVDELTARRLWPNHEAVGQKIRWIRQPEVALEVVGVVGAVRHRGAAQPPRPTIYRPHTQYPRNTMYVIARAQDGVRLSADAIAAAVNEIDPAQPIADVATMASLQTRSMAQAGFGASLAAALALLALALTAVGVYGLHAFIVEQRRRELGVRLAIGGTPGRVHALILTHGLRTTLVGVCVGLAAAIPLARWLHSIVPGGASVDGATLAFSAAVMLLVTLAACWIPARRASRLDPTLVLRADP